MKNVKIRFLLLSFFVAISLLNTKIEVRAQSCANYTTTRTTGISYSSIVTTGASIPSWRNNTGFLEQDDNRSNPVDIGFDFWYLGTRYTQFCVSTNGYIDFNTTNTSNGMGTGAYGYINNSFTNNTALTALALAPIYDDFTTQGGSDPLGNGIKYLVSGTAPNRVLTIEWINLAVYGDTTPNLNFQVKLYETTGVIEFIYGTMTPGTASYSYTCGINSLTQNPTATAAQLKNQRIANTNTFNNTETNNLSTLPASNSKITFTPPTPTAASGTVSFTGVSKVGMTVNWTAWATGHLGYVLYNSTDGTNFNFVTQVAPATSSYAATGLTAGTLYYWRVYAVSEGRLSTFLSGSQSTLPPGTFTSITSGNWGTAGTWDAAAVPTAGDNVIIANGTTVTVNNNFACNNLTVGQGASGILRIGSGGTPRTLTVNGNIIINTGAQLIAFTNLANNLVVNGSSITNNGTFDLNTTAPATCLLTINRNGNVALSGSGTTNRFNSITLNMSSINNTFEVSTTNFTAINNFLNINAGTFKYSVTGTSTINPRNTAFTLGTGRQIWINSSNATVNFTGGDITLQGKIRLSNGIINIGSAADHDLRFDGGTVQIEGGTLNVAGVIDRIGASALINYTQSAGDVNACRTGCGGSTNWPVTFDVAGSSIDISGGTIQVCNGSSGRGFRLTGISGTPITGGTLVIGNTFTSGVQNIQINASSAINNLQVNNSNVTAILNTNPLTVNNNVTISAGTLSANNLNITVGGNWVNNANAFVPGTATVTFNRNGNQSLGRSTGTEDFNDLQFSGSGAKSLTSNINGRNVTIASGCTLDVSSSAYTLNLTGNWSNSGLFLPHNGTVNFTGTTAQSISGSTQWYNVGLNNTAGLSMSSGTQNLIGNLSITAGNINTGGNLVLKSSDTATASIGTIPAGYSVSGNITMERLAPGGNTGWAILGVATNGNTLSSWTDDFYTSGFTGSTGEAAGFVSIYTYDETIVDSADYRYVPATDSGNSIIPGKGYFVYLGDGYSTTNDILIETTGPANQSDINLPVTYTTTPYGTSEDGWNLVSNPYPSAIDWDNINWTKTNISPTIYIYNADIGNYATYTTGVGGTNGGTRYVASSQGFFVKATGASPVLTIRENCKAVQNPPFFKTHPVLQQRPNMLVFKLESSNGLSDECLLNFTSSGTLNYDSNEDALKLFSSTTGAVNICTVSDSFNLTINTLPQNIANISIPLKALTNESGSLTLRLLTPENWPAGTCVTLEDIFTNQTYSIDKNFQLSFYELSSTNTARFILHINKPAQINLFDLSCDDNFSGVKIFANQNINGTISGSIGTFSFNLNLNDSLIQNLPTGSYTYSIQSGNCAVLNDTFSINDQSVVVEANFIIANDTIDLNQSNILTPINLSKNANQFHWFVNGVWVSADENPTITISDIGNVIIKLAVSYGFCTDTISKNIFVTNGITAYKQNLIDQVFMFKINDNTIGIRGLEQLKNANINLYDLNGKLILHKSMVTKSSTVFELPYGLSKGFYILKIDEIPDFRGYLTIQ